MDAFPQITYRDTVQKSQDSWEPSPWKKELLYLMCSRHLPTLLDRGYVECIKRQALNHMFEQDWRDYSSSWEDLSVSCSDQMFVRIRCFFFFFFPRYALQAAVQTPRSHLSTLQTDINPERHDYTWTHRVHIEDTFGMWSLGPHSEVVWAACDRILLAVCTQRVLSHNEGPPTQTTSSTKQKAEAATTDSS